MAFNPNPSGYFPNINMGEIVSGVTGVFIPWSSLDGLTTSTSGDVRQLYYSVCEAMYGPYSALVTADKSSSMTITLAQSFPSNTTIKRTYSGGFTLDFDFELVMASG